MVKNKEYNIEEFYVGELYLYTNFANFISDSYNQANKIDIFSQSRAINFQQDMESKYIDWENGREYTGFLTIFYKQGDKYICLHNGTSYELKGDNFIENLIPLTELLPKISTELIKSITIPRLLDLFDILFRQQTNLYNNDKYPITDFYIGDLSLRKIYHQESLPDSRYTYINLPYHIILDKTDLAIHSFKQSDYINVVYRCLFLKQGLDLYNIHNHQYYNPNEDTFQTIITLKEYLKEYNISISSDTISIPKSLKSFKRTLK